MKNYQHLLQWRKENSIRVSTRHEELNQFHDALMKKIVEMAINEVESELGSPPAHFAFFLMGSAGRREQTLISDQDHGIIHQGSDADNGYFLRLGKEIADGFAICGYPYCEGKVMASNPLWNKSLEDWIKQIHTWLEEESWTSLRNFTIFFDSSVLTGCEKLLMTVKKTIFENIDVHPALLFRLTENVRNIKKGISPIGRFITEKYGEKAGAIHLKEAAFFPYVNSLRLLALKEKLTAAATLDRFDSLSDDYRQIKAYKHDFSSLLSLRLKLMAGRKSGEHAHLIKINSLTKEEKQELKRLMKHGYKLFAETIATISKGV
ncbi:CBS domain-containing protein [Evansella caseinilytica]|uniref:CBS domain-containing protein n=1 Tax=Evansella caseinilytica TaxID=1503961 RepID=A0A1H3NWB7_9BACI|nr:DUF294 nucleotidyltransferase-like domain-containing protein [Evansella caseinilytica]SDY93010.1 CBS domain-containing protein [Evansella caseinilytica]